MYMKLIRSKKSLALTLGTVLLLLLLGALLIPNGAAKYRIQVATDPEAVVYNDRLAVSFTLSHQSPAKDGNCYYYLLPGTKSTFDPVITITGKTAIPAWLYLEIKGPDSTTLNGDWTLLDVTGLNGGRVYAYNTVLTDSTFKAADIRINPQITVAWDAVPAKNTNTTLHVYAYMIQQDNAETSAADAFTAAVSEESAP